MPVKRGVRAGCKGKDKESKGRGGGGKGWWGDECGAAVAWKSLKLEVFGHSFYLDNTTYTPTGA